MFILQLEKHLESAEWLNHILQRFWFVYEPNLSGTIVENVNFILDYYKPAMIVRMRRVC